MRTKLLLGAMSVSLLLAGCASATRDSVSTSIDAATKTPESTITAEPAESLPAAVPSRAEMSALERNVAESVFLSSVATEVGLTGIADDRLVAAGDAACDSMDRGDSSRAAYIVVAGLLPELTEIEQPVGITVMAQSVLCAEHSNY